MEVLGFIFGIFGLMAYLESSSLKKRVDELERELTKIKGTSFHEDRTTLVQAVNTYVGKKVNIEMKEDHGDMDIINYGNSKYGSITVLDSDDEWLLIHIESPKENMDKLIRLESIERISLIVK
ncbi:MAG: hypothetical protein IJJ19_02435 [Erysipelotrichaceae bacterium]|nr:hypothetical protein [Erysipelotrichaceae bacterium]